MGGKALLLNSPYQPALSRRQVVSSPNIGADLSPFLFYLIRSAGVGSGAWGVSFEVFDFSLDFWHARGGSARRNPLSANDLRLLLQNNI